MRDLSRFLRPRSIAVIGGGSWAGNVVQTCRKTGFAGPIWPVHPTKPEVGGVATFPGLEDLPGVPDATMIAVNRGTTVEAVGRLAEIGAGGAVCFASGFAEAARELPDGPRMQDDLVAAAGAMPILGPNCYGFVNALDGAALWPDQHGLRRVERGVAILTQSSNIALNLTMQRRGLPIAYIFACGNMAQLGMAELVSALVADPRVTAIGLHIEGIGDLPAFEAMAAAAYRQETPIVALKAGLSEAGGAAGLSHTAALAGTGAGARALLRRLAIAQVHTLPEMLETLKLLHVTGPLRGRDIVSLSCSGGEAGLMADAVAGTELAFPPLSEAQGSELRAALGPGVALANPLDYHTGIWAQEAAMTRVFTAMMQDCPSLAAVVVDFPRTDRCDGSAWEPVLASSGAATVQTGTPTALVASLPENMPEEVAERAISRGLAPLCGLSEALRAAEAAAWLGQVAPEPTPILPPGRASEPARVLSEAAAKRLLGRYGFPVPQGREAADVDHAVQAAEALGYPVALKAAGLAHKTEAGAVRLGLRTAEAVAVAAKAMGAQGFLVERMVAGGIAELLVGIRRDAAHGYLLTLGAGGVLAEVMADTQSLLLPVRDAQIETALRALRFWPVLKGYRGRPGADPAAIVSAVQAMAAFAADHAGALEEVEVNPLICGADFAVAADALIRLRGRDADG